jgi:WD40 repeat protein
MNRPNRQQASERAGRTLYHPAIKAFVIFLLISLHLSPVKAANETQKEITDKSNKIENPTTFTDEANKLFLADGTADVYEGIFQMCNEAIRNKRDLISAYYHRGLAYMLMENRKQYKLDCKSALRIKPSSADDYFIQGNVYTLFGYSEKAFTCYTEAVRIDPKYTRAYANRGFCHMFFKEDYDKAIDDYTTAIKLSNRNADYYANRSEAYLEKKRDTHNSKIQKLQYADMDKARKLDSDYNKQISHEFNPPFPNSDYTTTFSMFGLEPEFEYPDDSIISIESAHKYGPKYLYFTRDGKYLFSASMRVKKWDVENGDMIFESEEQQFTIRDMDLSLDEKLIATARPGFKLWSAINGEFIKESSQLAEKKRNAYNTAFTPDGKHILAYDGWVVSLFSTDNLESGKVIWDQEENYDLNEIVFNNSGSMLVLGTDVNTFELWNTENWEPLKEIANLQDYTRCIKFSPDDKYLVVGLNNGEVIVFSLDPIKIELDFFAHKGSTSAIDISPDGKLLATGGGPIFSDIGKRAKKPGLKIWSMESGELLYTFQGHNLYITSIAFSPDGKLIASGSGGNDALKFWQVNDIYEDLFH